MTSLLVKLTVKLQLLKDESGQDLIEYALLVVLIALIAAAGMERVGNNINTIFMKAGNKLITYGK